MNRKSFVKFGIIILTVFLSVVQAVGQNIKFTHYGTDEGLPSPETYFTHQDVNGYMWFGTDRGLCRYDLVLNSKTKQRQVVRFNRTHNNSKYNQFVESISLETDSTTLGGLLGTTTINFSDVFYNCVACLRETFTDLSDEDPDNHGTKVVINIPLK